jgi:MFS family permease
VSGKVGRYFGRFRTLSRNARLFLLSTVLQGFANGIWGVIFFFYLNLNEIGFKMDFIGNMAFAGTIATGLIALPAGLFCEHVGAKRGMLVGLSANLVNLTMVLIVDPAGLLIASLVSGFIGTISWVASAPFMMENSRSEERTYLFSFDWALMIIMGVVGSFVGGALPDVVNGCLGLSVGTNGSAFGYRVTLFLAVALALSAVFPVTLIREIRKKRVHSVSDLLSLRNVKSTKTIVKFMIPAAIIGFGAGFIVPLFNVFFKQRFLASSNQVGIMSACSNVTLGFGIMVAPEISRRLGKVKSVALFEYLSMPFIMLTTLSPSLPWAASAYVTRTALMNMAGPIGTTLQMENVSDSERATANGLMVMSDNIPRAIASSFSGAMMTGNDFITPFMFTTVTYFIASSIYYTFFRKIEYKQTTR